MWIFSRTTHVHILLLWRNMLFAVFSKTTLTSKIPRFLINWKRMEHNEAVTYSFSWACNKQYRILIIKMPGATIMTVWMRKYKTALSLDVVHCVMVWLFGYPLLWYVYFIWSEFIIYSCNESVTSFVNKIISSLEWLYIFPSMYINIREARSKVLGLAYVKLGIGGRLIGTRTGIGVTTYKKKYK